LRERSENKAGDFIVGTYIMLAYATMIGLLAAGAYCLYAALAGGTSCPFC